MKPKVIKSDQVEEQEFGVLKVKELLNTSEFKEVSIAEIQLNGKNQKVINNEGNIYLNNTS